MFYLTSFFRWPNYHFFSLIPFFSEQVQDKFLKCRPTSLKYDAPFAWLVEGFEVTTMPTNRLLGWGVGLWQGKKKTCISKLSRIIQCQSLLQKAHADN